MEATWLAAGPGHAPAPGPGAPSEMTLFANLHLGSNTGTRDQDGALPLPALVLQETKSYLLQPSLPCTLPPASTTEHPHGDGPILSVGTVQKGRGSPVSLESPLVGILWKGLQIPGVGHLSGLGVPSGILQPHGPQPAGPATEAWPAPATTGSSPFLLLAVA